MANQFVWVDIPVWDLERGIRFYSAVLGAPVNKFDYPEMSIGLLPGADGEVSGCLFVSEAVETTENCPLIYLNCQGRIDEAIEAVVPAAGKILQHKTQIGSHGFRAIITDSEGNRLALHSH